MSSEVGNLVNLGLPAELAKRVGFTCGTVAATGSTITDAAVLKEFSIVTGADATVGVKTPACDIGSVFIARNVANAVLKVYTSAAAETVYIAGTATPQAGDTAISIAAYYTIVLVKVTATAWIALELIGA